MQAIVTKYFGPTNYRGSRVKATCAAKSIIIPWDDALDVDDNHKAAAQALIDSLAWRGQWVGGGLPDGTGNCYVCVTPGLPAKGVICA